MQKAAITAEEGGLRHEERGCKRLGVLPQPLREPPRRESLVTGNYLFKKASVRHSERSEESQGLHPQPAPKAPSSGAQPVPPPRSGDIFLYLCMRYALFIVFLAVLPGRFYSQTASTPPGSGTSGDPYRIDNLSNLFWIAQEVMNSSNSFPGIFFVQTADIDASPTAGWYPDGNGNFLGWIPIGVNDASMASGKLFSGNYDGGNFCIRGLVCNRPAASYLGLFGYVMNAGISRVCMEATSITGSAFLATLAGYASYTNISHCKINGNVNGTGQYVGGLAGNVLNSSLIEACSFQGTISGSYRIGTFVGSSSASMIRNCYARGNTNSNTAGNVIVGGFIGYSQSSTISNCYTTASVYFQGITNLINKGFIGSSSSNTSTGNFVDTLASNQSTAIGAGSSTTELLLNRDTYLSAGWDLSFELSNGSSDFWSLSYSDNDGYPNLEGIQVLRWNGSQSTDWNDPLNWTPNGIPTSKTDVIIP